MVKRLTIKQGVDLIGELIERAGIIARKRGTYYNNYYAQEGFIWRSNCIFHYMETPCHRAIVGKTPVLCLRRTKTGWVLTRHTFKGPSAHRKAK